jgi:peptide methionine sulfoxide reductase MsrA
VGTQYRSAVFYADDDQRTVAEASAGQVARALDKPVATQIVPATEFYRAEEYHQDYVGKHGEAACPIPRFVTKAD